MSETIYVAGDFSGIQAYVLGITSHGAGQARRLRARSFKVQLAAEVAVRQLLDELANPDNAVIVNGGGQFLLRVPDTSETESRLAQFRRTAEERMFHDFSGELSLTIAWARDLHQALEVKERAKRRTWSDLLARAGVWDAESMSGDPIGEVCEICRKRHAASVRRDGDQTIPVCAACTLDIDLGRWAQKRHSIEFCPTGDFTLLGQGLRFRPANGEGRVDDLCLERYVPIRQNELLTFEEIAAQASGDPLLGVLKADVDNMGVTVAETIRQDPSYERLRILSRGLESFFGNTLQQTMRSPGGGDLDFRNLYTVYSGGDDLLIAGPWDVLVRFAIRVRDLFMAEFGRGSAFPLTLSAGIAFIKPKIPVRYAVERAEDLLAQAKSGTKDQCACLDVVLRWDRFKKMEAQGRQLADWTKSVRECQRTLLQRLYRLTTGSRINKSALWAWQVGRNFPGRGAHGAAAEFREWGLQVLNEARPQPMMETGASLLYALTATRRKERHDG